MDTELLEIVAQETSAIVLLDPPKIDAFLDLKAEGLINGALHLLPGGKRYVTVHGLTPDGNALLAIKRSLQRRASRRSTAH